MSDRAMEILEEMIEEKGKICPVPGTNETLLYLLAETGETRMPEACLTLANLIEFDILAVGLRVQKSNEWPDEQILWGITQGIPRPEMPAIIREVDGRMYLAVGGSAEEIDGRKLLGLAPNDIARMEGIFFSDVINRVSDLIGTEFEVENESGAMRQLDYWLWKIVEAIQA